MTANGPSLRLLPRLDDQNRFFWTSGADGTLRFLRCDDCARLVHPPAPVCPDCLGRNLAPAAVSGRAVLESFTVNHQQWIPGSDRYIVAWVAIAEQPDVRLTTNIIDTEPDTLVVGMELHVAFEQHDDVYLPLFAPAPGRPAAS